MVYRRVQGCVGFFFLFYKVRSLFRGEGCDQVFVDYQCWRQIKGSGLVEIREISYMQRKGCIIGNGVWELVVKLVVGFFFFYDLRMWYFVMGSIQRLECSLRFKGDYLFLLLRSYWSQERRRWGWLCLVECTNLTVQGNLGFCVLLDFVVFIIECKRES